MRARSLLFDLWGDYIQHVGGEVFTSTLAAYLSRFGISEAALRQALSRMSREGWLRGRRVGSRSCYSLTERGERRITQASRRVYRPDVRPWDGWWRVLTYSIPKPIGTKRNDLRRELAWTGFASPSPGSWISPNPLEEALQELIARYEIEPHVATFHSRHTGPGTPQELVRRCWDLAAIQRSYDRFIAAWAPRLSEFATTGGLPDDQCFVERINLVHEYRKFLFVDPGLPAELLPERWRGHEARQLFQTYYDLLNAGARHFMDGAFESARVAAGIVASDG